MSAQALRVVRQTTLRDQQKHVRFLQIDNDIADLLTSREATRVSTCLHNVYTRMKLALRKHQSQPGVLRIEGLTRDGKYLTPWEHLREITQVSNATLSKCLDYLEEQGIIGRRSHYRNGLPILIWFNYAESSVISDAPTGSSQSAQAPVKAPLPGQKNLRLVKASPAQADTSPGAASFSGSFNPTLNQEIVCAAPDCAATDSAAEFHKASEADGTAPLTAPQNNIGPATPSLAPDHHETRLPARLVSFIESALNQTVSRRINEAVNELTQQTAATVHESKRQLLEAIWGASEILHTHLDRSAAQASRIGSAEAFRTAQKQGWIKKPASNAQVGAQTTAPPAPDHLPDSGHQAAAMPPDKVQAAIDYGVMLCRLQTSATPELILERWMKEADFTLTTGEYEQIVAGIRSQIGREGKGTQ